MDVPTPHDLIDPRLWPATTVVVHLDNDTWQTGHGPVEVKGHGPITAEQAFTHLRHSQVTVRPVVDLNDDVAWVRGDGPFTGTLREAVWLTHPWSPFPYADTETRDDDDADHTVPRRLGGATILENGAPLRRRQHRYKTFAKGVRVKQPVPGILVWQDRHGGVYVCDRRGHTHDLGRVGTEDHSRARSAG